MSATTELSPWQALKSHQVNCNKGCTRKKVACPVGRLLLTRAMAEPKASKRLMSFPFVAKMFERILARINGEWVEAVVFDRSILQPEMYKPQDWKTGELKPWRTSSPRVVGYEVETDDRQRHYVNTGQVRSLRKRPERVSEKKVPSSVGQALRTVRPLESDLIIIRKG